MVAKLFSLLRAFFFSDLKTKVSRVGRNKMGPSGNLNHSYFVLRLILRCVWTDPASDSFYYINVEYSVELDWNAEYQM